MNIIKNAFLTLF